MSEITLNKMEEKIKSILVVTPAKNIIYSCDDFGKIEKKIDPKCVSGDKFVYEIYNKKNQLALLVPSSLNVIESYYREDDNPDDKKS